MTPFEMAEAEISLAIPSMTWIWSIPQIFRCLLAQLCNLECVRSFPGRLQNLDDVALHIAAYAVQTAFKFYVILPAIRLATCTFPPCRMTSDAHGISLAV